MRVKPLQDRVVVKRLEADQTTQGGIIIPDTAEEKPLEGQVTAVGAGKRSDDGQRLPLSVKKGDRVLFGKYSGNEIEIDGEEQLILREEEILAIVEA